jgi:hypothetical protein
MRRVGMGGPRDVTTGYSSPRAGWVPRPDATRAPAPALEAVCRIQADDPAEACKRMVEITRRVFGTRGRA